VWFATAHPTAAIIVVTLLVGFSIFLLYQLFRFLRRTFNKLVEI
jgi:formate hydrogenlyase subunit 3/multisubunit Na+/H+ antiporter MnhD subunit